MMMMTMTMMMMARMGTHGSQKVAGRHPVKCAAVAEPWPVKRAGLAGRATRTRLPNHGIRMDVDRGCMNLDGSVNVCWADV